MIFLVLPLVFLFANHCKAAPEERQSAPTVLPREATGLPNLIMSSRSPRWKRAAIGGGITKVTSKLSSNDPLNALAIASYQFQTLTERTDLQSRIVFSYFKSHEEQGMLTLEKTRTELEFLEEWNPVAVREPGYITLAGGFGLGQTALTWNAPLNGSDQAVSESSRQFNLHVKLQMAAVREFNCSEKTKCDIESFVYSEIPIDLNNSSGRSSPEILAFDEMRFGVGLMFGAGL